MDNTTQQATLTRQMLAEALREKGLRVTLPPADRFLCEKFCGDCGAKVE